MLVAFSLALFLLLGAVGLSFDIGRMYVTRSEGQSFVDSAAIAAALKLNGTAGGLVAARNAAAATVKRWQFGTTVFPFNSSTDVTFATAVTGPFLANPSPADGYSCARVTTRVSLPIFLLPVLVGATSSSIAASGVAKQIEVIAPGAGHYGPFSPYGAAQMIPLTGEGWNPKDPFNLVGAEVRPLTDPITYRVGGGKLYNILWPNNQQVELHSTDPDVVCPGFQYSSLVSIKTTDDATFGVGTSNRGYIYNQSSVVAATIIAGVLPSGYPPLDTGDSLVDGYFDVSNGAMHNNITSGLADRVNTDSDSTTQWYADYVSGHQGNGQRILLMPIDSGPCTATTFQPQGNGGLQLYNGTNTCMFPKFDGLGGTRYVPSYHVAGWGRFFLLPASYYDHISGNKGACAEYIGPGAVEGGGAGTGASLYVVKLVQ